MFKVNILTKPNGEFIKRELFNDGAHAESWSNDQKKITGFHYEIINLDLDKDYQYQKKVDERKAEYAKMLNKTLEALLEEKQGRPEKMAEVIAEYEKVKTDIPLPEKAAKGK